MEELWVNSGFNMPRVTYDNQLDKEYIIRNFYISSGSLYAIFQFDDCSDYYIRVVCLTQILHHIETFHPW